MLEQITSLHIETIVLLVALVLALINALVAALRAENWMKHGKQAMAIQNLSGAIHYFSQEILNHPQNVKAYLARAEAYRLNAEPEKALEDERTANELDPKATPTSAEQKMDPSFSGPFQSYDSASAQASLG